MEWNANENIKLFRQILHLNQLCLIGILECYVCRKLHTPAEFRCQRNSKFDGSIQMRNAVTKTGALACTKIFSKLSKGKRNRVRPPLFTLYGRRKTSHAGKAKWFRAFTCVISFSVSHRTCRYVYVHTCTTNTPPKFELSAKKKGEKKKFVFFILL